MGIKEVDKIVAERIAFLKTTGVAVGDIPNVSYRRAEGPRRMDSGPFSVHKRWKSHKYGLAVQTVRVDQLKTKHGVNEGIKRLLYQMQTTFPQHYEQIVQGLIQTIAREVDDMYTQGWYRR